MQAHTILTGTSSKRHNRRQLIATIGGTMLALSAVAGLARWQTAPDGTQGATIAAARPVAPEPAPASNAISAGRDTAGRGIRAANLVQSLYLVGSHEDADVMVRSLAPEGPLTSATDEAPVRRSVVVAASDAEAAHITALLTGEPRLTDGTDERPVVRVFDLRPAPATPGQPATLVPPAAAFDAPHLVP
jgi:hypothetical protein